MKQALAGIVLVGIVAVALVVSPESYDMFRLPKTLLLRAEALLIVAVVLGAIVFGARLPRPQWRDPAIAIPLAAFAMMIVLTLTSTRFATSANALATAAATLIVYFATYAAARNRSWMFVAVPIGAAMVNALLDVVQEANLWMPFGVKEGIAHHLQCTALVGNPNEVGSYLAVAALAALAAGSLPVAAGLVIGLVASRTLTAIAAFAAAAVVLYALSSWKRALRAVAIAVAAGAIVVLLFAPLRERATRMVRAGATGDYNFLLTDRVTPFLAASMMFTDHPLTGAGPGAFAWHYYDYKLQAEARHPPLRFAYSRGLNYGEVHNDHLQLLAEGGVAGYVMFLVAVGALASFSFGETGDDRHRQFARRLALPLAVLWLVLSLAQFPLETPVVRTLLIHFCAVCAAWRNG